MLDRRAFVRGSLLALAAASLFAMLGPLSRFAGEAGLGATGFVAWRAGIGAVGLGAALLVSGGWVTSVAGLRTLDSRGRAALGAAAAMGFTINLLIFTAFERIPIALALMLLYTYPALVAVVSVALGRDRLTPAKLAALGLASSGVVAILAGALGLGGAVNIDFVGILLALGAALSQTVFMVVSRSGYAAVPPATATVVILSVTAATTAAFAVATGAAADLAVPLDSAATWPHVLLAGVLGAAVPSVLFITAIQRIGGTQTGILMLWEPVVGVVLAALLLGEPLLPLQVAGGVMVIGAALILQLASDPETEPVAGPVDIV